MSKNKGKGGKNKRKGKKQGGEDTKRELEFKDEEQEYGQVTKMLGSGRLTAMCADGTERMCHIRGKFNKRVWINVGDIILLGLRGFEDGKADVIHKYSLDEARLLKGYGELPQSMNIELSRGAAFNEEEVDAEGIAFGSEEDEYASEYRASKGTVREQPKSDDENDDAIDTTKDWAKELENL